jgi:hypothetical protein
MIARLACAAPASAQTTPAERDACGEAAFAAADVAGTAFEGYRIPVAPAPTSDDLVRAWIASIQTASARAQAVARGYDRAFACGSPTWTVAALVRQAAAYETLVRAITVGSADVGALVGTPGAGARIRAATAPQLEPIRCLAVVRYVLAARAAHAGTLVTPEAIAASQRLADYGHDFAERCVEDQRTRDTSFAPLGPHEIPAARSP